MENARPSSSALRRGLLAGALAITASFLPAVAQDAGKGLVIVLIGPPGSGKTTQADFLQKKYKVAIVSADELRRKAGNSESKTNELLREQAKSQDAAKGFVLDGYPATRGEVEFLDGLVKELKLPAPIIIHLDVPDDVVRERLAKRDGKSANAQEVEAHLVKYHREMDLLRSNYPQGDIWTIIGTRPPRDVFNTIVSLVENRQ